MALLLVALLYPATAAPGPQLLLFGGPGHDQFLGCLTCSEFNSKSVHNEFGPYGSQFSPTSIRNGFSIYGSDYSQYSACSPYATEPPIIVDPGGDFYGRLTLNKFHRQRTRSDSFLRWVAVVCATN